jgi:hypothetical protein
MGLAPGVRSHLVSRFIRRYVDKVSSRRGSHIICGGMTDDLSGGYPDDHSQGVE